MTDQVTGFPAHVAEVSAAAVSPAVSRATPNGREESKTETSGNKSCSQSGGQSHTLKPNCYECVHRKELPGSAHSVCGHPEATSACGLIVCKALMQAAFNQIDAREVGASFGNVKIAAKKHGIRSGWFMWPFNFDPVWLTKCSLYEAAS